MSPERPVELATDPQATATTAPDAAQERARAQVIAASQAVTSASDQLEAARARRDEALLAAYQTGMTKKELADVSGLSQPAVATRLEKMGVQVLTHEQRAARRAERDRQRQRGA